MRKILLMIFASTIFLSANLSANSDRQGFYVNLGIGLNGVLHSTNSASAYSIAPELFTALGYRFSNGWEIISDTRFLGSAVRYKNNVYPLQGVQGVLSTAPQRGGLLIDISGGYTIGKNIITRENDAPLFLGVSLYTISGLGAASGLAPVQASFELSFVSLEAHGIIALADPKKKLDYALALDLPFSSEMSFLSEDGNEGTDTKSVKMDPSWGIRAHLGVRHYFTQRVSFFARGFARYHSIGASESAQITIPALQKGVNYPTTKRGVPSDVRYPKSSLAYVGVMFGIGF